MFPYLHTVPTSAFFCNLFYVYYVALSIYIYVCVYILFPGPHYL